MNEQIKAIAQKYGKNSIVEQWDRLASNQQLKIGFVGMFSAGKTSLINALLNTHLPVDPSPTTKSICIIESSEELTENAYFRESGMERLPISFHDFQNILNGNEFGVAVTCIPCRDEMPRGLVYIDTPGVDNFSAKESELTYRYLSLLDAAIVCIDINEGTVRQSLLDFISEPELFALSSRMFFVLTHSDLKMLDSIKNIEEEVFQKIMKYSASNHFNTKNLRERIISVNATDHDSSIKVVELIRTFILSRHQNIIRERCMRDEKNIAGQLSALLQEDVENLKCEMPELNDKKKRLQEEVLQIESEIRKHGSQLDAFREKLSAQIKTILQNHELDVTTAGTPAEMQATFRQINQEISAAAQGLMDSLKIQFALPTGAGSMCSELLLKMQRIDHTRDLTVTATTAALTAWICPGGSAAANAAEAAAGAATQAAGKAAQTAGKAAQAAERTAQAAGKVAETAGKAASSSTFKNIMAGIGKFIHDINPLEMLGDWAASELKHNTYASMVGVKANQIANNMIDMLEEPYEQTIILPLRNQYRERSASLDAVLDEREKGVRDFVDKRNDLLSAIDRLNVLAN